ncbi:hypothetical protein AVEN_124025-1 [Araneus ventricosus]|uniref:Uncharacterized protein n=1 Tax=Araneus ventricosus TaxID=182803 RepID=A0A4Y2KYT8_ARAVE|nr:hypothetical protein AVEN_124025-1 [Araneus ventricosus]
MAFSTPFFNVGTKSIPIKSLSCFASSFHDSKMPSTCAVMSLSQNSGILLFGRISCHLQDLPSSLSHLRYRTPSLRCKESQRAQYRFVAGLSRAISCQDGRSAEFSFFSRIGLIAGSSSCAFWMSHEDQGSTDVVAKAFTEVSVSIPNFFSALEQCLHLSLQRLRDRASAFS